MFCTARNCRSRSSLQQLFCKPASASSSLSSSLSSCRGRAVPQTHQNAKAYQTTHGSSNTTASPRHQSKLRFLIRPSLRHAFASSTVTTTNDSTTTATTITRTTQPKLNSEQLTRPQSSRAAMGPGPDPDPEQELPRYTPPQTGLISLFPRALQPFAELSRLDKPAGTLYLFFPCVFSTLLASGMAVPAIPLAAVCSTTLLFLSGAIIMRGAGCTINDLWDRNLDPHVSRTRLRPIARRAVTPLAAFVWFDIQCLAGLAVLVSFPNVSACLAWGVPSLLLVATYPLAKRVTYYPQAVLGLAFSWGAIMGFPAAGIDLLAVPEAAAAAALLYTSCAVWTLVYDAIYAHMDVKDDVKAGIKSIALAHGQSKTLLSGLAAVQVGLLASAGAVAGLGPVFFVGSCGSAALSLAYMIRKVDLSSVESCWWWFRHGCWITGGGISLGLFGEYLSVCLGQ